MDNLGEYIRHQREAKRLSIEELSEKTKISVAVLRDIEAGKFDRYKGDEAYVKMYLKKISSALSMDSESVTQQYVELTREIELEELREKEEINEHHEKAVSKGKKFSFEAPQFTRKPSVYEDKSHMTIIRTAIILVLVCLVIAVVWYGIYKTRSTTNDPQFVPNNNTTVEGDVTTPTEDDPNNNQANNNQNNTGTPTNANITFTRNSKLNFSFQLPENTEEFTLKIEFMNKSWAKMYVNGSVYKDFVSKIYHDTDSTEPDIVELKMKTADFENLRLQNGYSMGHRYYINGQQIPLTDEDYSEGVTYLELNLVKE